jgi:hypothetical protein
MTRPKSPYEAASYDLKEFRERRLAERRASPRQTMDRRALQEKCKDTPSHDKQFFGNPKLEKE